MFLYCTICSKSIHLSKRETWQGTFRAVYKYRETVCLSDIGRIIKITHSPTDYIDLRVDSQEPPKKPVYSVVIPINSAASQAWLMHDACWKILEVHLRRPISLKRLFEALRIFERPEARLGHILSEDHPPTEAVEFPRLLRAPKPLPDRSSRVHTLLTARIEPDAVGFHTLPLELRYEIASYLTTFDFYNLRFVSRCMGELLFSQSFWKTRFECHGDRCFLGSPDGGQPKIPRRANWQLLYYRTNERSLTRRLWERRDIWWRCRLISGVTDAKHSFPRFTNLKVLRWHYMSMHLPTSKPLLYLHIPKTRSVYGGCYSLPSLLRQIAVSVLEDEDETYITGVEFIGENETVKIGYINSRHRTIRDIRLLKGFKVAWSRVGVHAIRFKTGATACSWIGKATATCCVSDMSVRSNVYAVKMEFDEYKMTTVALDLFS